MLSAYPMVSTKPLPDTRPIATTVYDRCRGMHLDHTPVSVDVLHTVCQYIVNRHGFTLFANTDDMVIMRKSTGVAVLTRELDVEFSYHGASNTLYMSVANEFGAYQRVPDDRGPVAFTGNCAAWGVFASIDAAVAALPADLGTIVRYDHAIMCGNAREIADHDKRLCAAGWEMSE